MLVSQAVQMWHLEVLKRSNRDYHSSHMIDWIRSGQCGQVVMNTESIMRQHRLLKERHLINYHCVDAANGWYQAIPLAGAFVLTSLEEQLQDA